MRFKTRERASERDSSLHFRPRSKREFPMRIQHSVCRRETRDQTEVESRVVVPPKRDFISRIFLSAHFPEQSALSRSCMRRNSRASEFRTFSRAFSASANSRARFVLLAEEQKRGGGERSRARGGTLGPVRISVTGFVVDLRRNISLRESLAVIHGT